MSLITKLEEIFLPDRMSTHPDHLSVASHDESTLPPQIPSVIVWALSVDEVVAVVKLCGELGVPLTTRGGGSALEGSTIPSADGLVLDLSRMDAIENTWPDDLQVQVQPGIIYDNLNKHLKHDGLFFPPSPGGSGDLATVGGMVSTNASGIFSVKYGATRDWVLALELVDGLGRVHSLGCRALKNSSGYSLTDLIVGSEGTLGVVTSVTLHLAGLPESRLQTAYTFPNEEKAAKAVSEMMRYGLDLAAVEFLDRRVMEALNLLNDYGLQESPSLFLEFHGPPEATSSTSTLAESICLEHGGKTVSLSNPWEVRHYVTEAIKHRQPGFSIIRNDVAFPISFLPEVVAYCYEVAKEHELMIHTFGHVGLGLLHALILARKDDASEWKKALAANDKIIEKAVALDGTISGEHGIGLGHKNLFELEHGSSVELMRSIKKQFDPKNILNPGKIFDP